MTISLGIHSSKIDAVRALRTRKGRSEQGCFLIEGPTMLAEALDSGAGLEAVYATQTALDALGRMLEAATMPVYLLPERAMGRLSEVENPSGIVAVVKMEAQSLERMFAAGQPLALLAGISDPGNAGTLLRSAEIFGISGVIFGSGGVEPYNPKVVRASMGAIFRLELAMAQPEELLCVAHAHGYTLIAASGSGIALSTFVFPDRPLVAIGNERRGVRSWLPAWDVEVTIPNLGNGESLNAAVAGSIFFYVFSQQFAHASRSCNWD